MHLKRIKMENFKTFRKKVEIPIFKGFTGITGPNGSGKSNIADAILFVLGPRSSKMVRAKRLQDLIFHGNDRWKAAKQCRVTLAFDNQDRTIPIDNDEVELTRVIKISASDPDQTLSYFYVNGKSSSQGEFENILAHAHLSAEGYNIVLQGHINEFISKTPMKVREEIDDIAGIKRYDDEIQVAINKRNKAETNMENIRWRLDFFKDRLRELKKEKEEAEKYREAQNKINISKATLYHVQKEGVEGEIESYNRAITRANERKVELRGDIGKIEAIGLELDKEMNEVGAEIDEITGEEGKKLKEKLDEAKLELMRARDIIETAQDAISELGNEDRVRSEEIKDIVKKETRLGKEIEGSGAKLRKVEAKLEGQREEVKRLESELDSSDDELLNLRRRITLISKELEKKRDLLSEKVLERDRARAQLEVKSSSLSDIQQMISTLRYEIEDLKGDLKEARKSAEEVDVKKLQKNYMDAREEERHLIAKTKELEKEITRLNRLYTTMKMEVETSEKLKKGVSMAVDEILTARDKGEIRGIYGTIGELGDVPDEYETALEVAAGGRISAVVVDNDSVASSCIERLKAKRAGRVTFLPLNKLSTRRPGARSLTTKADPSVRGFAVDLISYDPMYEAAFQWVFSDTLIVNNLASLRKLMGGVRLVTLDGEIAGAGGDITGGSLSGKRGRKGFGSKSRGDLQNISDELQERTAESDSLTTRLNQVREEVNDLEARIRSITSEQTQGQGRITNLEETLGTSGEQLKERSGEERERVKEIEGLSKGIKALDKEIDQLEGFIKDRIKDRDGLTEELDKHTPRAIRESLKKLRSSLDSLGLERTNIMEKTHEDRAQLTLFSERSGGLKKRVLEIAKSIEASSSEERSAKVREERSQKEVKALETVLGSISEKTKDLYDRLNELNRKAERNIANKENARKDVMAQDSIMITQRTNIRTAEDRLAETLGMLQRFQDIDIGGPPYDNERDLLRNVRQLESILENSGNVNLRALEEYEEKQVKRQEIGEELKALEREKLELDKIIDEINGKRKEEFIKAYEGIDENFRKIYAHISGEGEAYFELENPQDPLSGGLIIRVKPPGKKMTRLEALSGGEKSLTSMAFIFSIQAWDPSPFYLLDEVDQNLDAVNAEIVAKMVRENSQFAQFVLISLRKISLKEAQHLYGVTLQNGDSVVLGQVDLKEVDAYEKASKAARRKEKEKTKVKKGGGTR